MKQERDELEKTAREFLDRDDSWRVPGLDSFIQIARIMCRFHLSMSGWREISETERWQVPEPSERVLLQHLRHGEMKYSLAEFSFGVWHTPFEGCIEPIAYMRLPPPFVPPAPSEPTQEGEND